MNTNRLFEECIANTTMTDKNKNLLLLYSRNYNIRKSNFKKKADIKMITNIISGQNHLADNESKRDPEVSPFCPYCPNEKETTEHFLTKCTRYTINRINYFGTSPCSLEHIFENHTASTIIRYTRNTKRFHKHDINLDK